jgi:hypothetical protein
MSAGGVNMKRSPVNPVSKKRARQQANRRKVLIEKFGLPDTWQCQIGYLIDTPCFGPIHGHELLKRSRGGAIDDIDNIVLACNHHNEWVESHPVEAHELGLSKHSWE